MKKMMLLKPITVRNLMSSNISILIMGPNFKIICVIVMCLDNNNITITTPFKILIIVALFMTLAIYV